SCVGVKQIERIERHGYLIPVMPRQERLARGRVLLIGDAAGLVDPITGEGITYAILSGQLAAKALCEGNLDVSQVCRRYDALLRRNILGELKAARILGNWMYNYPRLRCWAFRRQGKRLTDFMTDVVMGERTYRGALKSPTNYLKMLGLRGDELNELNGTLVTQSRKGAAQRSRNPRV